MFTFVFTSAAQASAAEPGCPMRSADCSNPVALIKEKPFQKLYPLRFLSSVLCESWIESASVVNLPLPEVKREEQRMMLRSGERKWLKDRQRTEDEMLPLRGDAGDKYWNSSFSKRRLCFVFCFKEINSASPKSHGMN